MSFSTIIASALTYLSVFGLSLALFFLVEKSYGYKGIRYRVARSSFLLIAILLPCILAGLRADNVGVDVKVYVVPNMEKAYLCNSFSEVSRAINNSSEYLYAFIVYLCSRFTSDGGPLLFLLQLFTIVPIVKSALLLKDRISITHVMAAYYFLFYNNSLNLMRQSVACAFVILGTCYWLQDHKMFNKNTVICHIVASMFHKSGWIGSGLMLGIYILQRLRIRTFVKFLIGGALIVFPFFLIELFELLSSWGLMTGSFQIYGKIFVYRTLERNYFINPFSRYALFNVFFNTGMVALPYLLMRGNRLEQEKRYEFLQTTTFFGLLLFLSILYGLQTNAGGRLTLYMDMFAIILLPYVIRKPNVNLKKYAVYIYFVLYWVVWVLIGGWSGSHIYSFRY